MSDKRRPPSVRPGPLPAREPNPIPPPGQVRVVVHFDTGGSADFLTGQEGLQRLVEAVGRAWDRSPEPMFVVTRPDGTPTLLIHLGKLRAVELG